MTIEESNEVKGQHDQVCTLGKTMMGNGARIKNRSAGMVDRGLAARNTAQVGLARHERLAVLDAGQCTIRDRWVWGCRNERARDASALISSTPACRNGRSIITLIRVSTHDSWFLTPARDDARSADCHHTERCSDGRLCLFCVACIGCLHRLPAYSTRCIVPGSPTAVRVWHKCSHTWELTSRLPLWVGRSACCSAKRRRGGKTLSCSNRA
jgi:hypothetical protein